MTKTLHKSLLLLLLFFTAGNAAFCSGVEGKHIAISHRARFSSHNRSLPVPTKSAFIKFRHGLDENDSRFTKALKNYTGNSCIATEPYCLFTDKVVFTARGQNMAPRKSPCSPSCALRAPPYLG